MFLLYHGINDQASVTLTQIIRVIDYKAQDSCEGDGGFGVGLVRGGNNEILIVWHVETEHIANKNK